MKFVYKGFEGESYQAMKYPGAWSYGLQTLVTSLPLRDGTVAFKAEASTSKTAVSLALYNYKQLALVQCALSRNRILPNIFSYSYRRHAQGTSEKASWNVHSGVSTAYTPTIL